jgi:alkanesulfonate monooxygenase SsuD/methylene tetrahydromethanopterin reductase-like flavin-dependent oxidoreductase (luciferase family)
VIAITVQPTVGVMDTDFVLNPFGAELSDLVAIARAADATSVGAVWVNDHFSGEMVGSPWSRDPFVCLGAIGAVTERVDIGILVANVTNRHPVQLASAVNSLQSLAPDRVRLGVGSGAAPGSRFASEHDMLVKPLRTTEERVRLLRESIASLKDIWANEPSNPSTSVGFTGLSAVVDGSVKPRLTVGASAWSTIEVAIDLADGVNIRRTSRLHEQLERLHAAELPAGFEVSVLDMREPGIPLGVVPRDLLDAGVDRYIVTVSPADDLEAVMEMESR